MKLTNLSLAVMVAVGVAACGGSGDDNSNKPADPPKQPTPNQPQQPQQPEAQTNPQQAVDPTGTQVVDDKDLTKQNTVGTLQYIRRDGSQYDRVLNPSKPASASPLLGTTLNDQNPRLTNIVLARQDITRADGTPVKAQFTGSDNPMPLKANGEIIQDSVTNGNSLQQENFGNVDVLAGMYDLHANQLETDSTDTDKLKEAEAKHFKTDNLDEHNQFSRRMTDRTFEYDVMNDERFPSTLYSPAGGGAATDMPLTAILSPTTHTIMVGGNPTYPWKDINGNEFTVYKRELPAVGNGKASTVVTPADATERKFGKDLVWWSAPQTAFENTFTRNGGRPTATDPAFTDSVIATVPNNARKFAGDIENSHAATNGLIRIGSINYNSGAAPTLPTLGQELNFNKETNKWEDHHKTATRIFGRYHLATVDGKNNELKPVALNSFSGVRSFAAAYEEGNKNKITQYSIGAIPSTLKHVQYGRVTTNLDLDAGKDGYPDGFIRSPFANKGDDNTVDNYFYRGTDATTIEQMAALPSNQTAVYNGHALMYGIDNSYHGSGGRNLPNAFAGTASGIGLGNFVEARVDFGKKRVLGEVYNEWLLDPSKAATTRDKLVRFQGNITGNTVIGSADRTYVAGDDCAIFKASFFGEKAEEMGGSFNTVQDTSKYGDAYGQNDWGGVFGASKGESTSNTFQGDDGANNYGQNNYSQL